MLASLGGRANAGGRVVFAWEGRAGAGEALASLGGRAKAWKGRVVARDALASPGQAVAGGGVGTCLGRNRSFPGGVFTWEGVIPSQGGLAWGGVIPSLGGFDLGIIYVYLGVV